MSLVQRSPGLYVVAAACVGFGRVIWVLLSFHGLWVQLSPSPVVLLEAVGKDEAVRVFRVLPAESLECLGKKQPSLVPDILHLTSLVEEQLSSLIYLR